MKEKSTKNSSRQKRKPVASASSSSIRLGFVPLIDAAPIIVAKELGFFEKQGIHVNLSRELGWALIRDKVIFGELDAAHAVAGLPFSATLGLRCAPQNCITSFVINLHGNAITVSSDIARYLKESKSNLKSYLDNHSNERKLTFGTVSLYSSHHFLLRQWLKQQGVNPDLEIEIAIVPPPQMAANLAEGNLDGFCAGEPWNSVAIRKGYGERASDSVSLSYGHPEKVLMARSDWASNHPGEHGALIRAMKAACSYCQNATHHSEITRIISKENYLDLDPNLVTSALRGDLGKSKHQQSLHDFYIFSSPTSNDPDESKAHWVSSNFQEAGLISLSKSARDHLTQKVFRRDYYINALNSTFTREEIHEEISATNLITT